MARQRFSSPLIGWWATQAHFPPVQQFAYTTHLWTHTQPVYLQTIHVISCINRSPSAASWLEFELGEFGRNAVKTCQTCRKRWGPSEVGTQMNAETPKKSPDYGNSREMFILGILRTRAKVFCFKQRIFRGFKVWWNTLDSTYRPEYLSGRWGLRVAWSTFLTVK